MTVISWNSTSEELVALFSEKIIVTPNTEDQAPVREQETEAKTFWKIYSQQLKTNVHQIVIKQLILTSHVGSPLFPLKYISSQHAFEPLQF